MNRAELINPGSSSVKARSDSARRGWHVGALSATAFLPVVRIAVNNLDQGLSFVRLFMWGLLFWAVGLSAFWMADRFDRSGTVRGRATVLVAMLSLLMYGSVVGNALRTDEPLLRLAIDVSLILGGWLLLRWPGVQRFALILPFFLLAAPVLDLATSSRSEVRDRESRMSVGFPEPPGDLDRNVYWFILDGYGRQDVLQALGGAYDLGSRLAEMGFQVDPKAVAPYEYTDLSLGATLSASYLPDVRDFAELRDIAWPIFEGNPAVLAWFDDAGYRRLHLPGARWPGWRCGPPSSTCLVGSSVHLEDALIQAVTILDPILDLLTFGRNDRLAKAVDPALAIDSALEIQEGDRIEARRFMTVVHVMSSHPPYRWLGTDCRAQPSSILMSNWLPVADYLDAVRCTGLRTVEAVELITREDPDSVVIVQGDHGPRLPADIWNQTDPGISPDTGLLGVLLAMRLPEGCTLGEGNNTVNVFRVVIECLSDSPVARLDSRSWYQGQDGQMHPASPDRGR